MTHRHFQASPTPAPTRVHYGCGHSKLLPDADTALPAMLHAAHACPECAREELANPFAGEFGFHLHTVADSSADMLPGWIASRKQALEVADVPAPTHRALTVQACIGPRSCPQADHGDGWVNHIAHLAYLHEAHGAGWSTVTIDNYDAASERQQALSAAE